MNSLKLYDLIYDPPPNWNKHINLQSVVKQESTEV